MQWSDQGMIIGASKHGETSAIIDVFCCERGRWSGLVRGGASRRVQPHLQAGTQVSVTWRARLDAHLGTYQVEPIKSRAELMNDALALAAFGSLCALLRFGLPERLALDTLYARTLALVDNIVAGGASWHKDYALWELDLLQSLGYGLDLSACAVTGTKESLKYISPKSGRAVSSEAGEDWKRRLFPIPVFYEQTSKESSKQIEPAEIQKSLDITGHFLQKFLAEALNKGELPAARARFIEQIQRQFAKE